MAKQDIDLWVGRYDYSDPEARRRWFKGQFSTIVKGFQKEVGYLPGLDMDERRVTRRMETALRTVDQARQMIGEDYPDYPGTSYFEHDWSYLNAMLLDGYDAIDWRNHLVYAASLWVLDELYEARKLYMAEQEILPKMTEEEAEDSELYWLAEDITFPQALILKVYNVLSHRNDDCKVYTKRNEPDRALLDEATLRGKHRQDVPSRQLFERLIQELPEEAVSSAVNEFRDKYWQLARSFFAGLRDNHARRDDLLHRHDRLEEKRSQYETKFVIGAFGPGPLQDIVQPKDISATIELENALVRCNDALHDQVTEKEEYAYCLHEYLYNCTEMKTSLYPEIFRKRMEDFHIENPYKLCFALLYLCDREDDLIWNYYFGTALASMIADSLPWARRNELEDFWAAEEEKDGPAAKELLPLYDIVFEDSEEEDETMRIPCSPAQMLHAASGVILPRNMSAGDRILPLLKRYGLSAEQSHLLTRLLSVTDGLSARYDTDFDSPVQEETTKSGETDTIPLPDEDLQRQYLALYKEHKELERAYSRLNGDNRRLKEHMETMQRQNKVNLAELASLRETIFIRQNDLEEAEDPDIALPLELKDSTVICGGHPTFINQLRKYVTGNVRFLSNVHISEDLIRNASAVWIQTNAISHSDYYRVTGICRKHDIPVRYFAYASARKCAEQMVRHK